LKHPCFQRAIKLSTSFPPSRRDVKFCLPSRFRAPDPLVVLSSFFFLFLLRNSLLLPPTRSRSVLSNFLFPSFTFWGHFFPFTAFSLSYCFESFFLRSPCVFCCTGWDGTANFLFSPFALGYFCPPPLSTPRSPF